ncbi:hypothetical protein QJU89_02985 [Pasteurella skyensis]|uniref:Uncharacterized protein n=1 Tax=Phocoenobacter skyensis TaxID=97481 RepID=A0AAJ6NBK3_9PAST|nr:hypothetical protein [Pasteurella skyensis]MDP8163488.1 hypothetical protein [Pasteurella skyensis]MDP8173803.1 hypothetical protein [Pasteurella skyensis]MDP8179952.1 hypothetical protein [Pasteurella skyensis]MDP8182649.1 hypothetical protein [Pasteurella skyensis]MDP8182662.1 hypothetical protein [Pasteurella skyensis]
MYAVIFDIDTSDSHHKCIREFMEKHDFDYYKNGIYWGNDSVNSVNCIIVVQQLIQEFPFLIDHIKDIRMFKIQENNDLMPAIKFIINN